MYYWDSYWVIRGLLLCDMFDTARGIVENMLFLVKQYGHMPNGNRKYYLQRAQPPFLIQMAAAYHSASGDDEFIRHYLQVGVPRKTLYPFLSSHVSSHICVQYLDVEFQFWYKNRMVDVRIKGETYRLARYNAATCTPRPESY